MIVSIQFDDQNLPLASCIGRALVNYGVAEVETVNMPNEGGPAVMDTEPEVEVIKTEDVAEPTPVGEGPFDRVPPAASVTPIIPAASPVGVSRLDENGVTFDPNYCGKAAQPFYGAGKRKGQWKKLRGLDDSTYDTWYAGQIGPGPAEQPVGNTGPAVEAFGEPVEPPVADTTAAFSGQPEPTPPPADDDVILGAGQLMKWISEQMNAGNLSQADVDSAYVTADVTPAKLFSGDPDAVGSLHRVLKASLS